MIYSQTLRQTPTTRKETLV